LLQTFYFKTKFSFSKFIAIKKLQNKEKGYNAFVSGMIALANKDYKRAILESKKISNHLDDNPSLVLLLKSEIFKVEKKYDELSVVYENMSKNKHTENLGYRGMMEQYLRAQDYHHAFIYGERLFNNNPFIEKIYDTLVSIIAKTNNWQQLLIISDRAFSKKIIDKKVYEENKSIGFFEIAKIKQLSEIEESLKYMQKALKFRKNFPPYIKLYINLLIQNKNYNLAKKSIKKAWNELPHAEYKESILSLAAHLEIEMSELVKYIAGASYKNEESIILMVEAFVESKKWDDARNQIKDLLDVRPKKEVCLLMAKIEEGDSGDVQKINAWTQRAKDGAANNIWICTISKKSQQTWSSVSEAGYFNSLEWRQPIMLDSLEIYEGLKINGN
jgi:HemY protein